MTTKKLLIVEDDKKLREEFARMLENSGYEVFQAGLVSTALMHLDLDLAVVVLDLRLPNGYGKKVVDELKGKRDDVPVVIMTGYPADAPTGWPVVEVLPKPCKGADLLCAVVNAHRQSTAIRSIRDTNRSLGESLPKKKEGEDGYAKSQ